MSSFSCLVFIAVLGVSLADPMPMPMAVCDNRMMEGAKTIYKRHCPFLMNLDLKDYLTCLGQKGLPIDNAVSRCAQSMKFDLNGAAFCDVNNDKKSMDNICCVITEELKNTTMTGCDKVDYSRWCLDELLIRKGVKPMKM